MAGAISVNKSNTVAVMLLELRRHLGSCKNCRNAMKARDTDAMCRWAKGRIVDIAIRWDANIGMRLQAKRSDGVCVMPCPDVSKHGPAYALSAEPVMVTGFAERLF
jgi:hypothetical protein